jgi:hypothetical protein
MDDQLSFLPDDWFTDLHVLAIRGEVGSVGEFSIDDELEVTLRVLVDSVQFQKKDKSSGPEHIRKHSAVTAKLVKVKKLEKASTVGVGKVKPAADQPGDAEDTGQIAAPPKQLDRGPTPDGVDPDTGEIVDAEVVDATAEADHELTEQQVAVLDMIRVQVSGSCAYLAERLSSVNGKVWSASSVRLIVKRLMEKDLVIELPLDEGAQVKEYRLTDAGSVLAEALA